MLVGVETGDDAAAYRSPSGDVIVATLDFFTPVVDNPYDFGRVAAANSLSDIYAMGGRPLFALSVVAFPVNRWLITRGRGHAVLHASGHHPNFPTRAVAAVAIAAFAFGSAVLIAQL